VKRIGFRQVNAFTSVPHSGNPAGVVLDAADLTAAQMQSIAREINVSETAFVLPPDRSEADVKVRWFSPAVEIPLCGHATVAAFHVMSEESRMKIQGDGEYRFSMETAKGILPIEVDRKAGVTTVGMGIPLPAFERVPHMKVDLVRLLGIGATEFDSSVPLLKDTYLYVFLKRLHSLFSLRPNFSAIGAFLAARNLMGMCLYTLETVDRESHVHSRFFAPNAGINEDPVTGTANGPLGVILYSHGLVGEAGASGPVVIRAEQGDAIGRRGRVTVEVTGDGRKPVSLTIRGSAITVINGEMVL
jgi:PhzF family phenazine biosynthesis protein